MGHLVGHSLFEYHWILEEAQTEHTLVKHIPGKHLIVGNYLSLTFIFIGLINTRVLKGLVESVTNEMWLVHCCCNFRLFHNPNHLAHVALLAQKQCILTWIRLSKTEPRNKIFIKIKLVENHVVIYYLLWGIPLTNWAWDKMDTTL